jgi:hypothetical protein
MMFMNGRSHVFSLIGALLIGFFGSAVLGQELLPIGKLLHNHCVRCHNPQKKKGGVDLTPLRDDQELGKQRKLVRRALEQIEKQSMPPPSEPNFTEVNRGRVIAWAKQALVLSEPKDPALRNPGPALIRRLNRYEYARSVRDLTGLEFDVATAVGMPEDASTHSFDNLAAGLTMSPILMEKYFAGADLLVEQLFKGPQNEEKKKGGQKRILDDIVIARPTKNVPAADAARTIAASFAARAYRRPVEKPEVDRLVRLFEETTKGGESFDVGVQRMLKATLVSPHFLFRIERDRELAGTKAYRISSRELAVRLSYFLWSTMPDAELAKLAHENTLFEPDVLTKQVRRMLADPKASALTESFAAQWTQIRNLTDARPTIEFFPTFTPRLRQAMADEVFAFFNHLRKENRSVLELLDADYTFVNDELARHYGLKGIKGSKGGDVQKVKLRDEDHRGGLAGMAGILALTSHTSRTSPTLRGKWVLEVIFGTPPEPPPPDVSQIAEEKTGAKNAASFRELLTRHAQEATCAGCHKKIDPLGFGLENFDPIGRWRPTGGPQKIDAAGVLPSGEKFNGPKELKALFVARKTDFLRNISEQMMTYALGRETQYFDEAAIQEIVGRLEREDARYESLILAVVESFPFQYRRNSDDRVND